MTLKSYLFLLLDCAFSSTSAQTLKKVFISDTSQLGEFIKEFQQDCIKIDDTYIDQGVIEVNIHSFIEGEKRIVPAQVLDEVGDRVFIAQTKVGRWVERYKPDGSIESRNLVRIMRGGGSPFSIVYVIDEKTGKIKKLKTV